jgi:hypothetical protein
MMHLSGPLYKANFAADNGSDQSWSLTKESPRIPIRRIVAQLLVLLEWSNM